MRAPTRRGLLGGAAALATAPTALAQPRPDADLIRRCHLLAEDELDSFYEYVTAPDGEEDDDRQPDRDSLHWIVATPATTPEGWRAKALALSAWDRDAFDGTDGDQGSAAPLLASLLRDMVGPVRDAIVARLAAKYGPLPKTYTANGMWLGSQTAPSSEPIATWFHPDTDLLRLGIELTEAWRLENEAFEVAGRGDDDPVIEAALKRSRAVLGQIEALTATTLHGLQVKMRAFQYCRCGEPITPESVLGAPKLSTRDDRLMVSILADLHAIGERT